ncbi:MAG: O-Antigen ligase [Smithella sp. PtaU1.Bin162]|nr:MAG: O-Antigen ligase [Smithella sp. PtaU1.Bin162]
MLAVFFLVWAHLSIKAYFPNPAFWIIGAGIIVFAACCFLLKSKEPFGFFLAVFACTHFAFADNQGGLWSYVICAVLLIAAVLKCPIDLRSASIPRVINWLLLLFVIHQVIGLLLNPYSGISNIQSVIVTCSQCVVFYFCASLEMSETNLRRIFSVWFLTAFFVFLVALNQKYPLLITSSPLLPQRQSWMNIIADTPAGAFGCSELFAEYFCMISVMSLIFIVYSKKMRQLRIKKYIPCAMLLLAAISLTMGGSRAAIILAGAAVSYMMLENVIFMPSIRNIGRAILLSGIVFLSIVFIMNFGSYFSLDKTIDDFSAIDISGISLNSIISGDSINRNAVYDPGYRRLAEKSWWIGYGYNLPENNRESLGITGEWFKDFHSLYLSLPIYYGWVGAGAYIMILLCTVFRAYICYLKNRRINNYLVPVALGFALIWAVFILDQIKIGITRNHSYFLLTWFLLGWTHAVANSITQLKRA